MLRLHLRHVHRIDPEMGHDITGELIRESRCEICGEKFDPRHRAAHMRNTHKIATPKKSRKTPKKREGIDNSSPDKPYCRFCKKTYSNKSNYTIHMREVHGDLNPTIAAHNCDECEAMFVVENSLRKHKDLLHTQTKGKGKRFRFVFKLTKMCYIKYKRGKSDKLASYSRVGWSL